MGHELAETFARELGPDDITIFCDPVYFGGTVDRSEGSERIVKLINEVGGQAIHIPERERCGEHIAKIALPGDRVVVSQISNPRDGMEIVEIPAQPLAQPPAQAATTDGGDAS